MGAVGRGEMLGKQYLMIERDWQVMVFVRSPWRATFYIAGGGEGGGRKGMGSRHFVA